jgi:hypothetical protein
VAHQRPRLGARLLAALGPRLLSGVIWLLGVTTRRQMHRAKALLDCWANGTPVIVACWHDRLLLLPLIYTGRRMVALVSQHGDGALAANAIARWGIESIRGSATRGGTAALLGLVRAQRRGADIAIVPDGPRGPRHVAKAGVIHLARATGAQIFPLTYAATPARRLRSWDRLVVPLPFARAIISVGEPLQIPRAADAEVVEEYRAELERRLTTLTAEAEARLALPRRRLAP